MINIISDLDCVCRCSQKPIKFVERSRVGVQMLCLSFSPGECGHVTVYV